MPLGVRAVLDAVVGTRLNDRAEQTLPDGFLTSPIASLDDRLSRNPLGLKQYSTIWCRTGLAGCTDGKLLEAKGRRMLDEDLGGLRPRGSELNSMSERGG